MSMNWILLQLAKITSFVASLRKRMGSPETGWVPSLKLGGYIKLNPQSLIQ